MSGGTAAVRVFGVAADIPGPAGGPDGGVLAHDPATGLTHRAQQQTEPTPGRLLLLDSAVTRWPVVHPSRLRRTQPVSVCWSPIVRCNLSCPHCLDDKAVPEAGASERIRTAGILASAGVLGVDISGGEPLLLRDLPQLAARLAAGGVAVSVTTNGWHLDRRVAELADVLDAVRVSLDGPDRLRHDALRGPGSYDRAVRGIRAAVQAGVPVQVQTVLMTTTAAAAQEFLDLAGRLGAGGVTFLQMLPIGEAASSAGRSAAGHPAPLDDEDAAALVAQLRRPAGLRVRLRTRAAAAGFTVVRADTRVWRNTAGALAISRLRPLRSAADLALTGPDGSA